MNFIKCFLLLLSFSFQEWGNWEPNDIFVEQTVDTIGIVHLDSGTEFVYFFDFVQKEWTILDSRWISGEMSYSFDGSKHKLFWWDTNDSCWRLITSTHFIETWTNKNPLTERNNAPWFAQLLQPGLKKPPEKK